MTQKSQFSHTLALLAHLHKYLHKQFTNPFTNTTVSPTNRQTILTRWVFSPLGWFTPIFELDSEAEQFLHSANEHAHLIFITNAEDRWIELSAEKYMPKVHKALQNLMLKLFPHEQRMKISLQIHHYIN